VTSLRHWPAFGSLVGQSPENGGALSCQQMLAFLFVVVTGYGGQKSLNAVQGQTPRKKYWGFPQKLMIFCLLYTDVLRKTANDYFANVAGQTV